MRINLKGIVILTFNINLFLSMNYYIFGDEMGLSIDNHNAENIVIESDGEIIEEIFTPLYNQVDLSIDIMDKTIDDILN